MQRLHRLLDDVSVEEQNRFLRNRGCSDATFSVLQALRARKRHGLSTTVAWVDLQRAFDGCPRAVVFAAASRLGVPPRLLDALKRLHDGASMEATFDTATATIPSRLGVRQGSQEGPLLFLCLFQAALESYELPEALSPPSFLTDGDPSAPEVPRRFTFARSLYADDAAVLFDSREQAEIGMRTPTPHLRSFGLHCHVGKSDAKSKTEMQYFETKGGCQEDGDTTPLQLGGGDVLHYCTLFEHLGTTTASDLSPDTEVDIRIGKAQGAFSVMRRVLTDRNLRLKTRARYFLVLVLPVLLHGAETWTLCATHMTKLTSFYRRCLRTMAHTSLWKTRLHRTKTSALLERAGLQPFITYLDKRILTWAGKVARMPPQRMPYRFLSARIDAKKPRGQTKTWGQTLRDCLKRNGVPAKDWMRAAQDEDGHPWLRGKDKQ